MANFNKSFNFRNGFQVDESTFIVRGGTVGIGSTVPKTRLDVDGTITTKGLVVTSEAPVGIVSANVEFLNATLIHSGIASISAGIITSSTSTGIVTYYGDARFLQGLPTSQWVDIDVGLGYTSIYASGNVGVDTVDPRYPFQVGGVPFPTIVGPSLPAQDGVGIIRGNIYASGIVSTRGEFIGLGSNITAIDGSNITAGAIGSMAYGDLIVTEEVIADKFTGIASTAISVTPDATLEFDTARANEFTAVNRFVSTTGKLQIGSDSTSSAVGDIDSFKTGSNSSVYSLSDRISKLFVGSQRQAGTARQFGGLRHGLVGSDPLTEIEDLDLVNYDIGNLNFYLHSGSGGPGITTGSFRWIYGQTNVCLAELSKEGVFSLNGNGTPGSLVLEVSGISSFSDAVYIDGNVDIPAGNDVNIGGNLLITGNFDISGSTVSFPSNTSIESLLVSDKIEVGNPPTSVLTILPTELTVGITTVSDGIILTSTLDAGDINSTNINSDNIIFNNSINGTGFDVTNTGNLSATSILVGVATISTELTSDRVTTNVLNVATSIDTPSITATIGNFDTIIATSSINFSTATFTDAEIDNITAGEVTISGDLDVFEVSMSKISTTSLTGGIFLDAFLTGNLSSGANVGFVTTNTLRTNSIVIAGTTMTISYDTTNARLTFSNPIIDGGQQYYADLPLTAV